MITHLGLITSAGPITSAGLVTSAWPIHQRGLIGRARSDGPGPAARR